MHKCKICGRDIQIHQSDVFGHCGGCGMVYHGGLPDRPRLSDEQWAALRAHAASKGLCEPDGEVKT